MGLKGPRPSPTFGPPNFFIANKSNTIEKI
jgi:hypothetical protein